MQQSPFTCIMCNQTKTNGKDYTWCRNPNCKSRDCLCVHCNVEHVERWFCSRRCKEESAAPPPPPPPKKKRSRSTASTRLDEETKQKALRFDRATELYALINETNEQLRAKYTQFNTCRRRVEELEPEVKQMCQQANEIKLALEAELVVLNKHVAAMKDMMNNTLRDVDFVQADSFEALAHMAKEKTLMQDKYRQKITQFKANETVFHEKQNKLDEAKREMEKMQQALEKDREVQRRAQVDLNECLTNA